MNKHLLTLERANEVLSYNPETGVFVWRVKRGKASAGSVAGAIQNGYRKISLDREQLKAHRLAWFMTHGRWPNFQIDHIDGNKDNNAITNLRDVAQCTNMQNRRQMKRKHSSLPMGVSPKSTGRFLASIQIGVFDTAEEAHAAYLRAKRLIHDGFVSK